MESEHYFCVDIQLKNKYIGSNMMSMLMNTEEERFMLQVLEGKNEFRKEAILADIFQSVYQYVLREEEQRYELGSEPYDSKYSFEEYRFEIIP